MTEYLSENEIKTPDEKESEAAPDTSSRNSSSQDSSFFQERPRDMYEEVTPQAREKDSFISFLKELPALILTAVIIAVVIKWLIIQPFYIPSQSMEPTLVPEDRVLVSKFIYRFVEPKPGDVIVFVAPNEGGKDFIKRIVATEGDTVKVIDGQLFINDKTAQQDFETMPGDYSNWGPETIKQDHVFVMGDNRPNSLDSRVFGQLPENAILGRAFMVYWPVDRVKLLN